MADDIDQIMAMIEDMQTSGSSSEKENLRAERPQEEKRITPSANDELTNIMKSIEDIQNMPPPAKEMPSKPSRIKSSLAPPQKPSRKKKTIEDPTKVMEENNVEEVFENESEPIPPSDPVPPRDHVPKRNSVQSCDTVSVDKSVTLTEPTKHETAESQCSGDSAERTTAQDIDHLLKDLEKNINSNKEAKQASTKKNIPESDNPLDAMLNNMINDSSEVTPTSKGTCPTCGRPVMGEAVAALGKVWHREHFVCTIDDREIGTDPYFSWNNQIYCERHYNELFSPQCAKCQEPILENMINAMDKSFHQLCFTCATCDKPFTTSFHEHEGNPYCQECYSDCVAPKCVSCSLPILSIYTAALDGYWHPKCFVCQEPGCGPFDKAKFFELNKKPYCEKHYLQRIGAACAHCRHPINGKCVSAMGKRFHPQHFICSLCQNPLTQGIFKEHFEKPYCHPCFQKIGKRYP